MLTLDILYGWDAERGLWRIEPDLEGLEGSGPFPEQAASLDEIWAELNKVASAFAWMAKLPHYRVILKATVPVPPEKP